MAKKEKNTPETKESEVQQAPSEETAEPAAQQPTELEQLQQKLEAEHNAYLRLAAEYDNFRKRSQKEREALYTDIKAETVGKFLSVYDNLERALANETS